MNKKGMAIPIVLIILVFAFSTLMFITSLHSKDRRRQIIVRENYRARYLAKGAIQLAPLKIKVLSPTNA